MLSELVLESEILNKVLDRHTLDKYEAIQIFDDAQKNPQELFQTAQSFREDNHGRIVTFSKKAFFNLINLCKDTCTYCTYKSEPGQETATMLDKQNVVELLHLAKKYHCVEALFVTGERPEERYDAARSWLKKNGFSSTAEYLVYCSELALSEGLFPHTNAGNLTKDEMRQLQKTNASMGLMLENASNRFAEKNMPHHLAPSKEPKQRLDVLKNSGELGIPMTTGLLIGIGETIPEIIDSIFAIKNIHDKYGNIQEVILQNFQPKPDTAMRGHPSAREAYFKIVIALTRIIMPQMNVQIPPNLSPESYQSFLSVGINDWGGVSPLTPDFVNPEFAWPSIKEIDENSKNAGFNLECRFPVYPEFIQSIPSKLKEKIQLLSDNKGLVREDYWR